MWASASKMVRTIFPHPTLPCEASEEIALNLAKSLMMSGPIHPAFYGGALYGQKPAHHDPRIQNWWDSLCQFDRGDAVVCVGRF